MKAEPVEGGRACGAPPLDVTQENMKTLKTLYSVTLACLGVLLLVGCEQTESISSITGSIENSSYSAYWSGNQRAMESLSLLVISDYANPDSAAKGQRLYGSSSKPLISGYHDHDGEVVTFAMVRPDTLLILDKYITVGEHAIIHVFRDLNGLLDVRVVSPDSEIAKPVLKQIAES